MGNKIPKFVIITKGPYKGIFGFYKGKRAGKLVIEMSATGKEALVDRDGIIPQEGKNEYIDISPRSAQSDDIVLESPVKMIASNKVGTSSLSNLVNSIEKDFLSSSSSKKKTSSLSNLVNSIEKDFLSSSKQKSLKKLLSSENRKSSDKMVAKTYEEGRVFENKIVDNEYTVILRDFLESIGKSYSVETFNNHLQILKAIELRNSKNFQKRTRKIIVVAYIFVVFNQQNENVPYNPLYTDLIRPNDNPEYILNVASKINYVRDITIPEFEKYINIVIEALSDITGKNVSIIPSKVFNRIELSQVPKRKTPVNVKFSPMILQNYKKVLDKEANDFALKYLKDTIQKELTTGNLSNEFKTSLEIMKDNIGSPDYILAFKEGKINSFKELKPWYNLIETVTSYYKKIDTEERKRAFDKFNEELNKAIKQIDTKDKEFRDEMNILQKNIQQELYIEALKKSNKKHKTILLKWVEYYQKLQQESKNNLSIYRSYPNKILYNKIKAIEVLHLEKGLPMFKDPEYKKILQHLIANYDQIVKIPFYQVNLIKQTNQLYSNEMMKLKEDAIVTLNLKVNHIYNRNISYKM